MDSDYGFNARSASRARRADETPRVSSAYNRNEASRKSTPTSSLLHDLLREKKAEDLRLSKVVELETSDLNHAYQPREIQSSPLGPMSARLEKTRKNGRASGVGGRSMSGPREMGLRELEEYISKLGKENFNLKLEIVFRRQRTEALEKQLEKMKNLEAEQVEAQKINEELLHELEKRDQAIQEAVTMICELEKKTEKLELTSTLRAPSTLVQQQESSPDENISPLLHSAHSTTAPKTPEARHTDRNHILSAIPSNSSLPKPTGTTSMLHRTPLRKASFLKSDNGSTRALRSLYLAEENNLRESPSFTSTTRPFSLRSKDEYEDTPDEDSYRMKSPALSVLSASSFLSIYEKPESPITGFPDVSITYPKIHRGSIDQESDAAPHIKRHRTIRLPKWIDDKESPSKARSMSPGLGFAEKFISIGSLLATSEPTESMESGDVAPEHQAYPWEEFVDPPSSVQKVTGSGTLPSTLEQTDSTDDSLYEGTPTLAPSHSSQERSTSSESADNDELASIGAPEWNPEPRESVSCEDEASDGNDQDIEQDSPEPPTSWTGSAAREFYQTPSADASLASHGNSMMFNGEDETADCDDQDNGQDSPELPIPLIGSVATRFHQTPSASLAPHGNSMIFSGDDNLPAEYATPFLYKYYPPHGATPPRMTRNTSQSSESGASPSPAHAGQITEQEWLRSKTTKQTPSPLKQAHHIHETKNPEAQHYQRLVTPPSEPKSTTTRPDTQSKLPRASSFGAPTLLPRPKRAALPRINSGEERPSTPTTNARDECVDETPASSDPGLAPKVAGAGSHAPRRAAANEGAEGRKWGKGLGRTASLKIKQSFGWKKGGI
ncbi:hypothetical protein MMC11_004470 [Xylographa trunciseda]|nr:hypothetical protein [Xylographa trunciseda]